MGCKVEITVTETDEFDQVRSMTYTQNNVYTTEDFEYICIKAANSWGFDDFFFGYPPDILKVRLSEKDE
jgi:hypothetical protein